jgi:hypothetical protein
MGLRKCTNPPWMKKIFLLFTIVAPAILPGFAQTEFPVSLEWKAPIEQSNQSFLYFEDAGYDENGMPVYGDIFENQKIGTATLTEVITTPLPPEWNDLIKDKNNLPLDFELKITNKIANSGNYAVYEIFPFRMNQGVVEILISATVNLELAKSEMIVEAREKSAANSVLATGNWIKIGTPQNGLYKISFSQLQNAGLISGSVNSNYIQLYGNGGGALPEKNSTFRYDDLQQNAIEVVDGGDGNFDNNDYILFYGQGPHQWTFNWADSSKFTHTYNVYADTNFYFITIGTTNGLRLTNRASLGGAPTYTTTTGDGYVFREDDLESLTHSGRQWVGDYYNFLNTHTYNFNLADIYTADPVKATIKMAARCVACNQTIGVKYGSTNILNLNPPQVGSGYMDNYASPATGTGTFTATGSNVDLTITKSALPAGSEAWLDYIEINYRKNITAGSGFSIFSDRKSLGQTNARFVVSNTNNNQQIWDITHPLSPVQQAFTLVGTNGEFQADMSDTLHSFIIFDPNGALTPASFLTVPNQNLHALTELNPPADFIIITPPSFLPAAQDLANFHTQQDGMVVHVATTDQIYNEYSSGKQDISAIRDYIKMYYDKHPTNYPKYVLLFGDGSYDYKPYLNRLDYDNTNFVPAFETLESFNRGGDSYCSDDFYALLDNNEGTNGSISLSASSNIDIGVGRIPARSLNEAQGVVNKIKYYATNTHCMGDWRNIVTFLADDVDADMDSDFIYESEELADSMEHYRPVYNVDKIYMDAYQEISNAGQRYPEVEKAIYNRINKGSLIFNYVGHGGETGMSAERVVQIDDFLALTNKDNLPAFITATCTFTRFDNPGFNSAGEYLLQEPDKGAICLFSTVRPINILKTLDKNIYNAAFTRQNDGTMKRLGDIIRFAKKYPVGTPAQNFLLFGDPALTLAYPDIQVVTDSINGVAANTTVGFIADTLMASQLVTITGHIEDLNGTLQNTYNGDLFTTIFDKASQLTTLGNGAGYPIPFELRKNVIFKGKSTIQNGRFTFQFLVPLDINYLIGEGKISYYATDNNTVDAHGYYANFNVGGSENNCATDSEGPQIEVFMNDTNFQEMGITQSATHLVVRVSDQHGINTTGLGIGHDLQAIIDNDIQNPINLNDYYSSDNNSYTHGTAEYFITGLSAGFHTVNVQVWDGCNNQANATLNFAVTNAEPALINFKAFPNPFSDIITLAFEHNFEGKNVVATVDINDLSGHTAKTFTKSYIPQGNREVSITWDGRSDGGEKMASGLYICRIMMQDDQGNQASGCCKIILVE